jgi:hypothetical protein
MICGNLCQTCLKTIENTAFLAAVGKRFVNLLAF